MLVSEGKKRGKKRERMFVCGVPLHYTGKKMFLCSVKDGIGLMAINDSFCLEGTIYLMLKKHFRSDPYYVEILELFHEVRLRRE